MLLKIALMNKEHWVVVDGTGLFYAAFFAPPRDSYVPSAFPQEVQEKDDGLDLILHVALQNLNKWFKELRPSKLIMCFDSPNWRKKYTQSDKCISKRIYKANRRQDMTPDERERYHKFLGHMDEFCSMLEKHTTVTVLKHDNLEADDLVSGVCQICIDKQITIVSTDKDFIQLLRHPNVKLLDPKSNEYRDLSEWDNNADYFMFVKNIRGDRGDNILQAYPGVRLLKIKKAFDDEYERVNMMNHKYKLIDGREVSVQQMFDENMLLMDLWSQPEEIKVAILEHIDSQLNKTKEFSHMHFLQFLRQHNLARISTNSDNYIKMLAS